MHSQVTSFFHSIHSISAPCTAYFGAVGTSCGLAYALNKYSQKIQENPKISTSMKGFMRGFVPFIAVASAGAPAVFPFSFSVTSFRLIGYFSSSC